MKPHKIIVIGGGTAGMMSATYCKAYWGNNVDITVVYDHKNPGIGVGESLTPIFDVFLKRVGLTTLDLIRNCNATIKLGLNYKNWTHEGSNGYHSFPLNCAYDATSETDRHFNLIHAYTALNNTYDNGTCYGKHYFETNRIPETILEERHALHIDATKLGRFLEWYARDTITVIDGIVQHVSTKDNNINSITLENGQTLTADLFIDCSGYQRVLIDKLNPNWVDISNELPTDRTIPNPLFKDFNNIPVCTTAEASKNGWILDVPLSSRHGTGYVYSSKFTSDEEAKQDFNSWLIKKYGVELESDRVIKYQNGYITNSWIGNCIALGMSSGFIEPLEATSIHVLVFQLESFAMKYNLKQINFNNTMYNTEISDYYNNCFRYIRFFYDTDRTDSEFWKYLTNNKPAWLVELNEKIKLDFLDNLSLGRTAHMFASSNFLNIAQGHGKLKDTSGIDSFLKNKALYDIAKFSSEEIQSIKNIKMQTSIDHAQWIKNILSSINI
tara:strand:+ start:24503 stop:25996 length:1494 start_codon:yes stop_codon:yes gene_type:complete